MTEKEIVQALRCSATREEKEKCEMRRKNELGCLRCFSRGQAAAANVIEQLDAENAKAEAERDALRLGWVSVDDKLPSPGTRVIATDGVFVGEAYRTSANTWRRYDGIVMRDGIESVVTHWMPLPEAPEEGGKA